MSKNKIKQIVNQHLFPKTDCVHQQVAPPGKVEAIAEAIVALPMDRVQAMALFVTDAGRGRYYVPDTEMKMHTVDFVRGVWRCHATKSFTLCSEGDCEHIRAAKLHQARQ